MQNLIEQVKTNIYLGGINVVLAVAVMAVLALLLLLRILYAGAGDQLTRPRVAVAGVLLAALLVLPLPIMLMFRPGVSAREAVGEIRYRDECAVCHGDQGNRLPGVSLGSQDYLEKLGDAAMAKVIKEGKGVMPAWGRDHEGPLGDDDIQMIVSYLKANARAGDQGEGRAATPTAAPQSGPPSADAGKQLFGNNCAACHGANGGRMPAAMLSSKAFVDALDDATLMAVVTSGKGSMPGFGAASGGALTDNDIKSIIAFLRTLPQQP